MERSNNWPPWLFKKKSKSGGSFGTRHQGEGTDIPITSRGNNPVKGSCKPFGCIIKGERSGESKEKHSLKSKGWRETKKNVLARLEREGIEIDKEDRKEIKKQAKEGETFASIKSYFTGREGSDKAIQNIISGGNVLFDTSKEDGGSSTDTQEDLAGSQRTGVLEKDTYKPGESASTKITYPEDTGCAAGETCPKPADETTSERHIKANF